MYVGRSIRMYVTMNVCIVRVFVSLYCKIRIYRHFQIFIFFKICKKFVKIHLIYRRPTVSTLVYAAFPFSFTVIYANGNYYSPHFSALSLHKNALMNTRLVHKLKF